MSQIKDVMSLVVIDDKLRQEVCIWQIHYIKKHILWSLILFLWGKKLFFRCIPNCTHNESLLVLLLVAICVMGIGIFLTWKRNRSYSSLAENIIMTWSVFVILAYVDLYKNRIIIISLVTAMVSVLMTLLYIIALTVQVRR